MVIERPSICHCEEWRRGSLDATAQISTAGCVEAEPKRYVLSASSGQQSVFSQLVMDFKMASKAIPFPPDIGGAKIPVKWSDVEACKVLGCSVGTGSIDDGYCVWFRVW